MPRRRTNALFELSGQWIGRNPGSPNLYRFWTTPGTGRTSRASLGTSDPETAKRVFAEAVLLKGPKTPSAPLAAVLEAYFRDRTDKLPSAKHARLAGKLMLQCWGATVRCSQLTDAKQREFAEASVARGNSLSYVSRNLSVLAAAVKHARLPIEIHFGRQDIKARWTLQTKAPRKIHIPSDAELVAFFSAPMPDALFRWAVVACLTGARPEAALDLTSAQRVREAGLLDLCPAGRTQNKKYRPIVREPKALAAWLNRWEREMRLEPLKEQPRYCPYSSVESVQTALERARAATGIPISAYSFRHKAVTVLRRARVSEDEIAVQIGHKRPHLAVTGMYGEYAPDYLERAAAALDAWWAALARKARGLNARPAGQGRMAKRPQAKLRLVADSA